MKKILLACCLFAAISGLPAADAPPAVQTQFDKLATAMKDKNFESFIADGNRTFLANVTKDLFIQACDEMNAKLEGGYTASYMGELHKTGYSLYYWKLTPKSGDDLLATLSVKDGKIGGFNIQ